jgi:transposase
VIEGLRMSGFIDEADRIQGILLPERVDEYVSEENPVRVIDAFVGELDLAKLGFDGVEAKSTGRPGYHPATMLKIYLYGYLNRVQSSRRLEQEARRNLELMWLVGRLAPDFKTLADFRAQNTAAIKNVCREFIVLCRQWGLFTEATVAIDGSKFKAVNHRDRNFTSGKMKTRMALIEQSIAEYLKQLDRMDRKETPSAPRQVTRLKERIGRLKQEMRRLRGLKSRMEATPDGQVSLIDPDARSMASQGKGTGTVGYNVQTAVDTKNHLIVTHEVTNVGSDRHQLKKMADAARDALGTDKLTAIADRGYYSGEEIKACDDAGIVPLVPKSMTSNSRADGRYDKSDFVYIPKRDAYRCPAGEYAIRRFTSIEHGMAIYKYWSSACPRCAIRSKCTTSEYRRIGRWEHEQVLDQMQARLDRDPSRMQLRRQTAEHPFGTIKSWMGATHFLCRTLPKVSAEMSLHVLAYNLKRVMRIMGTGALMQALRT